MARQRSQYVCQQCGGVHSKWSGQCTIAAAGTALLKNVRKSPGPAGRSKGKAVELESLKSSGQTLPRIKTGIAEFDRVLGGGLVPGSATLIGGDPGIGKSTLLLQMACKMATAGASTAYFSGEETADQISLRASRLNLDGTPPDGVGIATLTDASNIAASLQASPGVGLAIIDSIQTMYLPRLRAVRVRSARCGPCA